MQRKTDNGTATQRGERYGRLVVTDYAVGSQTTRHGKFFSTKEIWDVESLEKMTIIVEQREEMTPDCDERGTSIAEQMILSDPSRLD